MFIGVLRIELFRAVVEQDGGRAQIAKRVSDVGANPEPRIGFIIRAQLEIDALFRAHVFKNHFKITLSDTEPFDPARVVVVSPDLSWFFEGDEIDLTERATRFLHLTAS